jgi:hypothetical protein
MKNLQFNVLQELFLKDKVGIVIEDRPYSQKERDELEDKVASYMMEHTGLQDEPPDDDALMCEDMLDIIN